MKECPFEGCLTSGVHAHAPSARRLREDADKSLMWFLPVIDGPSGDVVVTVVDPKL